ncbi:hypothetical protein BDZ97DRAFT_1828371 [Flammula alnicola]|nr:hypothetical protein BDZ97DRAFT_1828371 [Flammula alnicola]
MSVVKRKFGQITGLETLGLFWVVFTMPLVQGWRLLWKPFVATDRVRSWRRVIADAGFGYAASVYEKWAAGSGVTLLWATPRGRKRLLVYFHGGGYVLPAPPFALSFWKHVSNILEEKEDVSLAFFEYTLVPSAEFPTPLKQSVTCIKYLMASGIVPDDIFLVGDSAGAGLILQFWDTCFIPSPARRERRRNGSRGSKGWFHECSSLLEKLNACGTISKVFPKTSVPCIEHITSLMGRSLPGNRTMESGLLE